MALRLDHGRDYRPARGRPYRLSQQLYIGGTVVNRVHYIWSSPPNSANVGITDDYAIGALDGDGDGISFSLATGPAGM